MGGSLKKTNVMLTFNIFMGVMQGTNQNEIHLNLRKH